MHLEEILKYLSDNDCELDHELETDEFYVIVNQVSGRVSQLVKDQIISGNTAVMLFRVLNIPCHPGLEDYEAVLEAHEREVIKSRTIFPNRLN